MSSSSQACAPSESLTHEAQHSATPAPPARHVLVVDDEYGPRQSLRMLLKEEYEVHLAQGADEALALIEEQPISVVVSDIRMPKVSGVDLLEKIKNVNQGIEVIIMTGYGELETAMKAVQFGAYSYMEKPFDTQHMLDTVHAAYQKHEADTQRRMMENLALEASRFETLGRFVSGTMHDLGTPLTVLSSHLELLTLNPHRDDAGKRMDIMREQVKFCTDIARSTMDFLRHDRGVEAPMQLTNVIHSCLSVGQPYFRETKALCETQLTRNLPKIMGESVLLRQCIMNIINNACQAMQDQDDHRTIYLSTAEEDGFVCLTIEDNGPGIPQEKQPQVFDLFYSTKGSDGTGLGLSVVKNIMARSGGSIDIIPGLRGSGACFLLRFPIHQEDNLPS